MAKAKTPWIFEKPGRGGIWVGWYDALGRRHNKKFPNQSLAKQHVARLTLELNDEFRPTGSAVPTSWDDLLDMYRQHLRFKGRTESTIARRFTTKCNHRHDCHQCEPVHHICPPFLHLDATTFSLLTCRLFPRLRLIQALGLHTFPWPDRLSAWSYECFWKKLTKGFPQVALRNRLKRRANAEMACRQ